MSTPSPDIRHLLRANLVDSLRDGFVGTEEDLQRAVDELVTMAQRKGREIREKRAEL